MIESHRGISSVLDDISTTMGPTAVRPAITLAESFQELATDLDFERSVKLNRSGAHWDRFLIGIDPSQATQSRVVACAEEIGMPRTLVRQLCNQYHAPSSVLAGFERQGERILYKIYLEFWDQVVEQVRGSGDRFAPILLNIGFKWDIRDRRKRATTRYVCHPLLSPGQILQRIQALFGRHEQIVLEGLERIVEMCRKRVARPSFVYMEAEERGARTSFDLNLYSSDLPLAEITAPVVAIHDALSGSDPAFELALGRARFGTLGHISAGYDRQGQPFVTIYFEE